MGEKESAVREASASSAVLGGNCSASHLPTENCSFLNVESETPAKRPQHPTNHTGANSKDGKIIHDFICARDRVSRCSRIVEDWGCVRKELGEANESMPNGTTNGQCERAVDCGCMRSMRWICSAWEMGTWFLR